jgi:Flp pilus assembly protein TadD
MATANLAAATEANLSERVKREPVWLGLVCILFLIAATVLVYCRVWRHEFLDYDDMPFVVHNENLNPLTWESVGRFWTEPNSKLYSPVFFTFLAAETWLLQPTADESGGRTMDPVVFHVGNLVLHVLNTLLAYVVLRRLVGLRVAAMLGALAFAVHPLQVESVAWVTEAKGLLATLFGLLAIQQYLAFVGANRAKSATLLEVPTAWKSLHWGLATVCFGLALLSKPTAAAIPLMVLVLDLGWLRRDWQASVMALAPWVVMSLVLTMVTMMQQPAEEQKEHTATWARPFVAADAMTFYAWKVVAPTGLAPDYSRTPSVVLDQALTYFGWLALVALGGALWTLPDARQWLTAALIFLMALLPVSGLIPFHFQDLSTVADRYAYLALFGVALAIAWGVARYAHPAVRAVVLIVCVAWGVASYLQANAWHDEIALFRHGARTNMDSYLSFSHLGLAYVKQGKDDQAIPYLKRAAEIRRTSPEALSNLCIALFRNGQFQESVQACREAIRVDATYAPAHQHMAMLMMKFNRPEEAVQHATEAVRLKPESGAAHSALAEALWRTGERTRALEEFKEAVTVAPNSASAQHDLAKALAFSGQAAEAVIAYDKAIALAPRQPAARVELATLLIGTRQSEQVNRAIDLLYTALDIDPKVPRGRQMLGVALGMNGDRSLAIDNFKLALEQNPSDAALHNDLGMLLAAQDEVDAAEAEFRKALELNPKLDDAHANLARLLQMRGQSDEAAVEYRAALALNPKIPSAWQELGALLLKQGQKDQAVQAFRALVELEPENAQGHHRLGMAQAQAGKPVEAADSYREAIRLLPGWGEPANDLAWLLATSPDDAFRNADEALAVIRPLSEAGGDQDPNLLDTLAAALAAQGSYEAAVEAARKAATLAEAAMNTPLSEAIRQRLALYEQQQPYREPAATP